MSTPDVVSHGQEDVPVQTSSTVAHLREITDKQPGHQPHPTSYRFVHSFSPTILPLPLISPFWLCTSHAEVIARSLQVIWGFASRGVVECFSANKDGKQHLPQGLESPEGVRTSTSPIVYILPRIQIKKFILLRMGCFQFSPLGARLWCHLISFFLMICLHQDLTYPLGSLWKETQSQWALQWLSLFPNQTGSGPRLDEDFPHWVTSSRALPIHVLVSNQAFEEGRWSSLCGFGHQSLEWPTSLDHLLE